MKKNRKRQKGFSLVELIVVIAVMAVLVVVLAPAYLRYVDKARLQKDVSAIGEVIEAVKIAASEESVSAEIAIPTDTSKAFAEYGVLSYAQVIIHGQSSESVETGTISANKMKTDIGWADVGHIVEGIFTGSLTVPREEAPNLYREVVATVGEKVEFGSKNLKKLDVILTVTRDADYKIHVTVNVDSFKHYDDVYEALQVFEDTGFDNSAKCTHNWVDSVCTKCNETCTHSKGYSYRETDEENHTISCKYGCDYSASEAHDTATSGTCVCGKECPHEYTVAGYTSHGDLQAIEINIPFIGKRSIAGGHDVEYKCSLCPKSYKNTNERHTYDSNSICTICGAKCNHQITVLGFTVRFNESGTCTNCGQ